MSHTYSLLTVSRTGPVERVTLNRPDVRNAFNETLIAELAAWAQAVRDDPSVRVVVIAGAGKHFCAGADAAWMARSAQHSYDENVRDATAAAAMFYAIDTLPTPVLGRIQGAALGGGSGLAAVCDIVIASDDAVFGFTEVKLGLLPAMISPYAIAKIGVSAARELFLTGARFSAVRAKEIGLAHAVVAAERLDATVDHYVGELLSAAPQATSAAKALIPVAAGGATPAVRAATVDAIARQRTSAEGQEGLGAFLAKRPPSWIVN